MKVQNQDIRQLDTMIAGSTDEAIIGHATREVVNSLMEFIAPAYLDRDPAFSKLSQLRKLIQKRLQKMENLIADIILSINRRAEVVRSSEYKELIKMEGEQWKMESKEELIFGERVCVDAGVTREAVAGSEGHMGRSLAGDDELVFVPAKGHFVLAPSAFRKRLIHAARTGTKTMLEIFIEHTGCGRRGQMIANLTSHNAVSHLFSLVFDNIEALLPEFEGDAYRVTRAIQTIKEVWQTRRMVADGGVWAGILIKIAQRQAYRHIGYDFRPIIAIELYDKMNGNLYAGIDTVEALTHPVVLSEGGFTQKALDVLVRENIVFSMSDAVQRGDVSWLDGISKKKGRYTFADLQSNWLSVKKEFVGVTGLLWEQYMKRSGGIQEWADSFLEKCLQGVGRDFEKNSESTRELMRRRMLQQMFRTFAYAWVLDTLERGNPPGKHMEDHLATGESAVLGVKEHLPLGQGDMLPPKATEFFTGRAVLLHSVPGHEGEPIVVFMKHDTNQPDNKPLTGEETQRAMDDFRELLSLWPYIVLGDMIPVVMVRGKAHGGIGRLALSVMNAFGDILDLHANKALPELVPANTSTGEVVLVPAAKVLSVGIESGEKLTEFRRRVEAIADMYADSTTQVRFGI